jgi:hypothetical protein
VPLLRRRVRPQGLAQRGQQRLRVWLLLQAQQRMRQEP